ncbi:MAG: large conductance mechanosensitive channel [Cellvibrionaceae bacterium]|jgi:large conductance mechanosensitive channel
MLPLGLALGGVNFSDLAYVLQAEVGDRPPVTLAWGKFVQTIIDFLIVAIAVFVGIKVMNSLKKKEEAAPAAPAEQEVLLEEIRGLLKK